MWNNESRHQWYLELFYQVRHAVPIYLGYFCLADFTVLCSLLFTFY
jgi:hypothetical protein